MKFRIRNFFATLEKQKEAFDTDLSLILVLTSDFSLLSGIKMKKRFLQEVGKTGEITSFIKSQLTKKPIKILSQNFGIEIITESKTFSMAKYASVGVEFGINFDINWEYYSIRSDRINFFRQFQMDCWISARVTTKKIKFGAKKIKFDTNVDRSSQKIEKK